ncbi:putative immunity protein [Bradyrhizobium barranii]
MILTKEPDFRLVTIRRGGTLTDDDHCHLAHYAATCAEHVLPFFERVRPDDERPRRAIELERAWARGEVKMMEARATAFVADAAAKNVPEPAKYTTLAAGQAAPVAHVAAHALGRRPTRSVPCGRPLLMERARRPAARIRPTEGSKYRQTSNALSSRSQTGHVRTHEFHFHT